MLRKLYTPVDEQLNNAYGRYESLLTGSLEHLSHSVKLPEDNESIFYARPPSTSLNTSTICITFSLMCQGTDYQLYVSPPIRQAIHCQLISAIETRRIETLDLFQGSISCPETTQT